ncbi:hypothetical protein ACFL2Q_16745 [Thermodesulfobacteriota bacterium]
MPGQESSRELNAKVAIECIRGPMSNSELMDKFRITPKGFEDLLKQLLSRNLISREDLVKRGIKVKVQGKKPATMREQMLPPPPSDEDEEFVDTVTLTEMLSFGPPPDKGGSSGDDEIPDPDEEDDEDEDDATESKGRLTLSRFFKKSR